jgi:hypothetical protein
MKELIRQILKENEERYDWKYDIKKIIDDEGLFSVAELVGGLDNLKMLLKGDTEIVETINSLNGKVNLVTQLDRDFYEFPMEFNIIGKQVNRWRNKTWPIINLKYDISRFNGRDREKFESFVNHSIGDLNFMNIDINPKVRKMFTDNSYFEVGKVNGKNYKYDEDSTHYDEGDIRRWVKKYGRNHSLNENEEDPTKDILNFLLRRYSIEEHNYGDDDDPIIKKSVCFEIDKREVICVNQFMNKQSQIRHILNGLMHVGIVDDFEFNETRNNPYAQKAIRAVKMFLNQVIG